MNIFKNLGTALGTLFLVGLFVLCQSCGGGEPGKPDGPKKLNVPDDFTVRVLIKGNPDGLNKFVSQSAISGEILDNNVNCQLLEVNPDGFELRPYVAVARPEVKVLENNKMSITYEIREEATWDDGTPITAADYVFTIKAIKNPKANTAPVKPAVDFIEDIIIDPNNNKKFTIMCNKLYMLAEANTGTMDILPAYFYDAQGLMADFTIPELNDEKNLDRLLSDPRITDFAEEFNNGFNHDPEKVVGGGAYKVVEIATHQHVRLERKKEWWGDKVDVDYIAAYPEKILFRIIDDDNNAILTLKEGELDVMTYIPPERFLEMREDTRVTDNFNLYTPDGFAYRYVGLNMKQNKLSDVRVRKAITHLVDKAHVIDQLYNGLAMPVNGPVSPLKKHFNKNIPSIEFDVDKAKALLTEAGWADSDGDNILDKVIAGKKENLKLRYLYPQGKQFYKNLAQIMKDEASRVGIEFDLIASEWSVMVEDMKNRNFDLISLGWGQTPFLDDFKQIWHTSSIPYPGSNAVGFGDLKSDALIDAIRETIDEAKRNEMYMEFQEIVAEQHPYIFLFAPKMCTAISKRFVNANSTSMRPGYWVRLFKEPGRAETN